MAAATETQIKVLMLPWLAYGHISPFLELAKRLAARNFFLYFCSTPVNLNFIQKKLSAKHLLSIKLVELHLPSSPELPPHYHTTNGLPSHLMPALTHAAEMASPDFSDLLRTLMPDLVIYDYNPSWTPDTVSSHNIPAIQFISASAAVASLYLHTTKYPDKPYPYPEVYPWGLEGLGSRAGHESTADVDQLPKTERCSFFEFLKKSRDIILIKTFWEMEGKYIDYLSEISEQTIVPVGVLVEHPVTINENEDDDDTRIIQWLDSKDNSSTVFVSFGSECFLTKEEIVEIAHGLELSEVNFLWVLRYPEALPEGFLQRVGERGVVAGWAPQVRILAHSSVGGFVSHCGWGSVSESMKFGVPIIAVPLHADQPVNARLVEEVGVGVEVMRDASEGGLKREEIARVIREVVMEENGEGVRTKAREFGDSMRLNNEDEIEGVVEEIIRICSCKGK